MWLLIIAIFGLIVPNGLFIYWTVFEFESFSAFISNKLAVAFIIDAFLAVGVLAYLFHKNRIVRYKWYWFVILSFIGGLGFSIPFYSWLNRKTVTGGVL